MPTHELLEIHRSKVSLQHAIDKAAADGKWQAAAWKLERRYPAQYGKQEKRLLEHSGEITADKEDVDTRIEKWRQLIEELKADANGSEQTVGDSGFGWQKKERRVVVVRTYLLHFRFSLFARCSRGGTSDPYRGNHCYDGYDNCV